MHVASHKIRVEFVGAEVARQVAPTRNHGHRDRRTVVLRLHVAESESHRFEVIGEDVGDAVLGAVDLDALCEGNG